MTDRSDAHVVRWQPRDRAARRLVFEPRSDGDFLRVEQVRNHAGEWDPVGREVVEQVGFENIPAACVDDTQTSYECANCSEGLSTPLPNVCPNCGDTMATPK